MRPLSVIAPTETTPPTAPAAPNSSSTLVQPSCIENPSQIEERRGSGAYSQRGLTLVAGHGARLYDSQGRSYLDCMAGHGTAILGHSHPRLVEAVQQQAAVLITCPGSFANDVRARFLDRLGECLQGYERFFLCNSGTEAIEAALKYARWHTGRQRVIATRRAFHGRTLGALAATWAPRHRQTAGSILPPVDHVPFNDLDAVAESLGNDVAAVLVEPIQGEGGVRPADRRYLEGLRRLCRRYGALLIFDEVQTGMGRTGKWLASQHWQVQADLVALAKGLGGGVPLGALAIAEGLPAWPAGTHGSTFGGNPLACAAGLATLQTLGEENLLARATRFGEWALARLRDGLEDSPRVRDIRGYGLMIGVELRHRVTPLLRQLMDEDAILALPAGSTVLRLLPPLVITEPDWRWAVGRIVERLNQPN